MATAFQIQDAKVVQPNFSEIGRSGYKRFGWVINEEFLPSLRGLRGIRTYREMRDNDPIIGATLYAIEQVINKATWSIRAAGSSALDKEAANFLRSCMHDMDHTWSDFISEVLSFLTYGWAWLEILFKVRKGWSNNPDTRSKENDGMIGWCGIHRRMQSSLNQWIFDDDPSLGGVNPNATGRIVAMEQMAPPDYKVRRIPYDKSLLFRVQIEGNNPEGRSILRNAYRPWFFKKNIEEIEAIGVERDLVGVPVITPPEGFDIDAPQNAGTKAEVTKIIANLRRDEQEGICLPVGWTIVLLQIGSSRRQFDTDRIINRLDKRIAATMLAQFIMLGMDRVGSFALSRNQNDLFLVAVQALLKKISDTLNEVAIPQLFRYNQQFMALGNKLPRLTPQKVTDPNLNDLSNYVSRLAGKGFILPTEHVLEELKRAAELSSKDIDQVGNIEEDVEDKLVVLPTPKPPKGQKVPPPNQEDD